MIFKFMEVMQCRDDGEQERGLNGQDINRHVGHDIALRNEG